MLRIALGTMKARLSPAAILRDAALRPLLRMRTVVVAGGSTGNIFFAAMSFFGLLNRPLPESRNGEVE
jgi:hypothetical protein